MHKIKINVYIFNRHNDIHTYVIFSGIQHVVYIIYQRGHMKRELLFDFCMINKIIRLHFSCLLIYIILSLFRYPKSTKIEVSQIASAIM